MNEIDTKDLRRALGQYMTGVTIVTTAGDNDEPMGITANSFSSVSLEPPLVLWSLSNGAYSTLAFRNAEYFCIHVLTALQQELAERFAQAGADKFGGLDLSRGLGSVPLLDEYVARFQCRTVNQHTVGDHIVFFGEVVEYDKTDKRPLVFHDGRYSHAERRRKVEGARRDKANGGFRRDRRASASARKKSDN